ncbi:hypothetical protein DEJ44_35200 [Streptomyces venezuelae]|nr:hypothetical protein DEJ44_35200 [Streptomyces venezuelae]
MSPPVTRTAFPGSRVAWWLLRAVASPAVGVQPSAAGSYSSQWARAVWLPRPTARIPPTMRTRPSSKRTAGCPKRASVIGRTGIQVPATGSYASADRRVRWESAERTAAPPATRTRPSGRRVAEWEKRASRSRPVPVQVSVAGSYTSHESRPVAGAGPGGSPMPPATRTRPSASRVVECSRRPVPRAPAEDHVLAAGSKSAVTSVGSRRPSSPPARSTRPSGSWTAASAGGAQKPANGIAPAGDQWPDADWRGVSVARMSPGPGAVSVAGALPVAGAVSPARAVRRAARRCGSAITG